MATFHVRNFGCRTNQADGALIERQLEAAGFERCRSATAAEIVVLNTCTVTASADADARAAIRRLRRENPGCRVLVTGCYAQRMPREIAALPGVEWVVGNDAKAGIGRLMATALGSAAAARAPDKHACAGNGLASASRAQPAGAADFVPLFALGGEAAPAHTEIAATGPWAGDRTRPNVKVQDGCNNRCSFCVIPAVRGASRSLPLGAVLAEIQRLADLGAAEVVLTGINLGQWGRELDPKLRLAGLVEAILARTTVARLRLSSVEPMDWSDALIALMAAAPRLARHAHVPLQSGSDAVLRRMHRRYRPWHYAEKIHRIHERMPTAAIGADVMAGFPGETEAEFAETCRFITELPLTYLHVFTYSARPGTEADGKTHSTAGPHSVSADATASPGWQLVPAAVAAGRSRALHELAAQKRAAFRRQFLGRELDVITLGGDDLAPPGGLAAGGQPLPTRALSDNFLPVNVRGRFPANTRLRVRVDDATAEPLTATPVSALGNCPSIPAGTP